MNPPHEEILFVLARTKPASESLARSAATPAQRHP
jgi:hypothetical protein